MLDSIQLVDQDVSVLRLSNGVALELLKLDILFIDELSDVSDELLVVAARHWYWLWLWHRRNSSRWMNNRRDLNRMRVHFVLLSSLLLSLDLLLED